MNTLRGFIVLITALFISRAGDCGVIGRFVARGCTFLLGAYGTGLLVTALLGVGLVHVVPKAGWRVLGRLTWRGLCAFGRVVRWWLVGTRSKTVKAAVDTRPSAKVIPIRPAPVSILDESAKVKDVRGALKSLQYTGFEITSVMPMLNESDTVENMIRAAIKLLQGKKEKAA
jgi:hypothetical protein